ncbi:MAG: hypothetical protein SGPRY_001560 [Prymnesium sp.]
MRAHECKLAAAGEVARGKGIPNISSTAQAAAKRTATNQSGGDDDVQSKGEYLEAWSARRRPLWARLSTELPPESAHKM